MTKTANPSNAEREGHPVSVPQTNGTPDRTQLSSTGKRADEILIDIYFNQYLMDGWDGNSGDYLVHSALLSCSQRIGISRAFLRLEEKTDSRGFKRIGHGSFINGLPQANKNDAKAGINIDSFGGCKLLSHEETDVQRSIISAAAQTGSDICAYIRNMNQSWITPSESTLVEIGGAKAINMNSFLLCYPTKLVKYSRKGISGGKIQAVDNGQTHLDDLLKNYRNVYVTQMNTPKDLFQSNANFTMQHLYEFVYLYEIRYPERERAMVNFFRKVDVAFLEHILRIKCMTYMVEERVVRKMVELMGEEEGIFISLFFGLNPQKGGSQAFFTHGFLIAPQIKYYDIVNHSTTEPPYKTFFHEFGHAIDFLAKDGNGFYTDDFTFEQEADRWKLVYDGTNDVFFITAVKVKKKLTIHEWAGIDLENSLIQLAYEMIKGNDHVQDPLKRSAERYASTSLSQSQYYQIASYVIYNRILVWDGASKSSVQLNDEINDLYEDICFRVIEERLTAINGSPVLPLDLFGGLTNNQVGGGHNNDYWIDSLGNRKITISKEAFAGYFEYRVNVFQASIRKDIINPLITNTSRCFTYTELALEGMFNNVV